MPLPPVPSLFTTKKQSILSSLSSVLNTSKKDLSPQGFPDQAILPLLARINDLPGVVSTSSCSGRVCVFLEGGSTTTVEEEAVGDDSGDEGDGSKGDDGEDGEDGEDGDSVEEEGEVEGEVEGRRQRKGKRRVKGKGGRWLFVSHECVDVGAVTSPPTGKKTVGGTSVEGGEGSDGDEGGILWKIFGRSNAHGNDNGSSDLNLGKGECGVERMRLVRLLFEPMILHIMTASLAHASSILTAAINAGFRESGVQSLKNLEDPQNAFPMVAIRSSGLAFESLIGYVVNDEISTRDVEDSVHSLVSMEHLRLLLEIANRRFETNRERAQRFEANLFQKRETSISAWEEPASRQARKRAEGLMRREELRKAKKTKIENQNQNKDENTGAAVEIDTDELGENPAEEMLGLLSL